jgi:CRISPR system Cascade subunit CasD
MANLPLLLLRLEGPLQSWGLRARWDHRDSGSEPSKSGLIGLLGCALGYSMYDPRLEELDRQLTLGVRVENAGKPLRDFQTVTGVLPKADGGVKGRADDPSTIISPRTYLQDAAFLAVFGGPEELLKRCHEALITPRWPVYLGRKSCPPSRPVLEGLTYDYDSLRELLKSYPWSWEGVAVLKKIPSQLRCVIEDQAGEALRPDRIRTNPARMYDNRKVSVFRVNFPGIKEVSQCTSPV